ncbi:hypothetical protein P8452_05882 [Trifolium repens]|nr:hypothetical protein P8452_05882 [Trifolium repens]
MSLPEIYGGGLGSCRSSVVHHRVGGEEPWCCFFPLIVSISISVNRYRSRPSKLNLIRFRRFGGSSDDHGFDARSVLNQID